MYDKLLRCINTWYMSNTKRNELEFYYKSRNIYNPLVYIIIYVQ